jgi:hypothetical protein
MTIVTILFVIALVGVVLAASYDIVLTNRGIQKGVAVEGNSWIDFIFGTNKPRLFDLILFETVIDLLMSGPAIYGFIGHNPILVCVTLGMFVAWIARHIQGGLAWAKLLK